MYDTVDQPQEESQRKYYGKYPGVVLDNDPPAGNRRGELKVEVHGILEETSDGSGQRPIQVIAAPCYPPGFFFIPEVKDNVWIEFGAGDINTPIWIGVWYAKDKTPKNAEGQEPTTFQKIIRTVSGNVIQLDDSDKKENITILHKSGSTVEIDKDGNIAITVKGDDMSIKGSKNISLNSSDGISLSSDEILLGGSAATDHLVLGDTLKTQLGTILQQIADHFHPTGVGPSGPSPVLQATLSSLLTPAILSTKHKTE